MLYPVSLLSVIITGLYPRVQSPMLMTMVTRMLIILLLAMLMMVTTMLTKMILVTMMNDDDHHQAGPVSALPAICIFFPDSTGLNCRLHSGAAKSTSARVLHFLFGNTLLMLGHFALFDTISCIL